MLFFTFYGVHYFIEKICDDNKKKQKNYETSEKKRNEYCKKILTSNDRLILFLMEMSFTFF